MAGHLFYGANVKLNRACLMLAGCLAGSLAVSANTATITFTGVTTFTDGTVIPTPVTYDLYQGLKGAAKVKVGSVTSGGQVTTGLLTGSEYCWYVVANVADANPSAPSNEACKNFKGTVGAVTITVT